MAKKALRKQAANTEVETGTSPLTSARLELPIPLDNLVLLPEMQVRARTEPKVVEDYRRALNAGAVFPPVLVARVGGALLLVDGFHRVTASRALHRGEIAAEVFDAGSIEEARWEAARANLRHGLPLKRGERREVFRAYVRARRHRVDGRKRERVKSYREMAADLPGFPHTTLRNWMRSDFPSIYRALGGGTETGRATGGLGPLETSEEALARTVVDALEQALAALPGVKDAVVRGEMLERVEALREALVAAGTEPRPF